jgi:hypothetical protein
MVSLNFLQSLTSPGEHAEKTNKRLETVTAVPTAPLRSTPSIETVAEVNEHADTDEPILVPVVTCTLESESQPPMDAVFQYVAAVCERLHRVYADEHVRQFDVRFEFGPDRFIRGRDCRRVTVPPEMAANLSAPGYDSRNLATDIKEGDDGDSVTPPVLWGECVSYTGGDGGAAAVGATAGAGGCGGAGGC